MVTPHRTPSATPSATPQATPSATGHHPRRHPWQHLPTSSAIEGCHQHPTNTPHDTFNDTLSDTPYNTFSDTLDDTPPRKNPRISRSPTPRLEVRTPLAKAVWATINQTKQNKTNKLEGTSKNQKKVTKTDPNIKPKNKVQDIPATSPCATQTRRDCYSHRWPRKSYAVAAHQDEDRDLSAQRNLRDEICRIVLSNKFLYWLYVSFM